MPGFRRVSPRASRGVQWQAAALDRPDAASAALVAEVIGRCPSGALHYQAPGIAGEQPDVPATVRAVERGPFLLRGDLRIQAAGGWVTDTRAALCRCTRSARQPFCDAASTPPNRRARPIAQKNKDRDPPGPVRTSNRRSERLRDRGSAVSGERRDRVFCAGSCLSLSFPESSGGGWACGLSRTGPPGRLVAVSLVAVSAGMLERSLGVPGAGLRPFRGRLCRRALGPGAAGASGFPVTGPASCGPRLRCRSFAQPGWGASDGRPSGFAHRRVRSAYRRSVTGRRWVAGTSAFRRPDDHPAGSGTARGPGGGFAPGTVIHMSTAPLVHMCTGG